MPACGGFIAPSGKGLCEGADGMGQTTGNTGVSWRQVLPVAGCLGLVEFGLMVALLRFPAQVSPAWAIPVGELLYLLLPAAAGFALAHWGRATARDGARAGIRMGVVSGLAVTLGIGVVLTVGLVRDWITPPPSTSSHWYPYTYSPTLDAVVSVVTWVLLSACNAVGVALSSVGALGGAALARWLRAAKRAVRVDPGTGPT